ncbi:MAG: hypothetical protein GPJ02_08090 [Microcystis aeruginosa G13-12]|nr:hypothetical protein [Microcystis aeruginosa SX13-11]NCR43976.1 hypothetical protein [Microcystis aeruginosa SX13-01]NCS15547.1 hypothetical protein [Microcystis aeruginosa G13-12]NCS21866.1 hypothetical protein [Microcystis aeruginosa G11-06]NCS34743.1 hypothetical protein [Microcystis aeruginosa G11-01]NCT62795.1 hypothetical protein [Microcystis aeruginosa G13-01]
MGITVRFTAVRMSTQKFIDANRNLERWLVQTGKTTLGPDILRSLPQEFGGDF